MKPFLRWAGGKQWLVPRLVDLARAGITYYEPFLGGGSLFFATQPTRAVLSDVNPNLIATYQVVRDRTRDLIDVLSRWPNDEDTYYGVRATTYTDEVDRAAQFIYLNKTCWNGLYRVNRQGQFNVPFGHHGRSVYEEEALLSASAALQHATLICCDFENALKNAGPGDFIYLDPPYTVQHSNNSFRQYNERLFGWQDQIRLSNIAHELTRHGCLVVVSNAYHADVLGLYRSFSCHRLARASVLAASPAYRRMVDEALFVYPNGLIGKSLE